MLRVSRGQVLSPALKQSLPVLLTSLSVGFIHNSRESQVSRTLSAHIRRAWCLEALDGLASLRFQSCLLHTKHLPGSAWVPLSKHHRLGTFHGSPMEESLQLSLLASGFSGHTASLPNIQCQTCYHWFLFYGLVFLVIFTIRRTPVTPVWIIVSITI